MARNSFRYPGTHPTLPNVLKAHGYVETNEPGDLKQAELDSFALEPNKWRWNGTAWIAFVLPPPTDTELQNRIEKFTIAEALYFLDRINELRILPIIGLTSITVAQMKQGIVDKYKSLP